ncbi:helicase protein, partial [Ancylostoma duodenale]
DDIPAFIDLPAPKGYITQRVIEKGERIAQSPGWLPNFDKDLSWLIGLLEGDLRMHNMKKEGPFKKSTVIFVERKITSNYLAIFFQLNGYLMEPLNSWFDAALMATYIFRDYTPQDNSNTIARMKRGEIQGVVATNKMSRGQDIPEVDHVIVYEMAQSFDDYTHRKK